MERTSDSAVNVERRTAAQGALEELLRATLVRGMHGTVALEVSIQDGTIQHVRERVERIRK